MKPDTKNFVFRARVDARHQEKINRLLAATGCSNQSVLFRHLVERAEVDQPAINVSLNANSDTTRQGNSVAVSA